MKDAVNIIASFVWNLHVKRALTDAPGRNEDQNFWRVILGSTLDMAVIEWCKLFGSDGDSAHWKNHVPEAEYDAFRADLYTAVALPEADWLAYRERVKAYRDQHAAHFDPQYLNPMQPPTYPDMSHALEAAFYYYAWLIARMDRDGVQHNYSPRLRQYCQQFAANAVQIATVAYRATANMGVR